jgi:hypothetical protein
MLTHRFGLKNALTPLKLWHSSWHGKIAPRRFLLKSAQTLRRTQLPSYRAYINAMQCLTSFLPKSSDWSIDVPQHFLSHLIIDVRDQMKGQGHTYDPAAASRAPFNQILALQTTFSKGYHQNKQDRWWLLAMVMASWCEENFVTLGMPSTEHWILYCVVFRCRTKSCDKIPKQENDVRWTFPANLCMFVTQPLNNV